MADSETSILNLEYEYVDFNADDDSAEAPPRAWTSRGYIRLPLWPQIREIFEKVKKVEVQEHRCQGSRWKRNQPERSQRYRLTIIDPETQDVSIRHSLGDLNPAPR